MTQYDGFLKNNIVGKNTNVHDGLRLYPTVPTSNIVEYRLIFCDFVVDFCFAVKGDIRFGSVVHGSPLRTGMDFRSRLLYGLGDK